MRTQMESIAQYNNGKYFGDEISGLPDSSVIQPETHLI